MDIADVNIGLFDEKHDPLLSSTSTEEEEKLEPKQDTEIKLDKTYNTLETTALIQETLANLYQNLIPEKLNIFVYDLN